MLVVKKMPDGTFSIVDLLTGDITYTSKKEIREIEDCPGVFRIFTKDDVKYLDIYGRKIEGLYGSRLGGFFSGIYKKTFKGLKYYFFNDVLSTYEPLIYDMLCIEYEYDYGPYDDFHRVEKIPVQTSSFILFRDNKNNKIYLYRKATGTYEELVYDYTGSLDINMNFDHNIIKINNTYYYITPFEAIRITKLFKDKKFDWTTSIMEVTDSILSFEEFRSRILNNKDFMDNIREQVKKLKKERYQKHLEETKRIKEQEEKLKRLKRKKEILQTMSNLMKELKELDSGVSDKLDSDRLEIEEDILLIDVDDHKEINPVFIEYLSLIDLQFISFKNVKVSGIDFSYSNARINPQEVYNKDMSNGNYSGLDFNIFNFEGVNIKGSKFIDCMMDFTQFTNVIKDENTVLPNGKKI